MNASEILLGNSEIPIKVIHYILHLRALLCLGS
jgi:hypothetical protein